MTVNTPKDVRIESIPPKGDSYADHGVRYWVIVGGVTGGLVSEVISWFVLRALFSNIKILFNLVGIITGALLGWAAAWLISRHAGLGRKAEWISCILLGASIGTFVLPVGINVFVHVTADPRAHELVEHSALELSAGALAGVAIAGTLMWNCMRKSRVSPVECKNSDVGCKNSDS